MIIIPFDTSADFEQEIVIENTPYLFRFRWIDRFEYWKMDIKTINNDPILMGAKLVVGNELISQYVDIGLPSGEMYVLNEDASLTRLDRNSFQNGYSLVYLTESEIDAL